MTGLNSFLPVDASSITLPPMRLSHTHSLYPSHFTVTIRSLQNGKYWQVLTDSVSGKISLAASASSAQSGHESTVFVLEREGSNDNGGGWVLLRWLKTRQLVEVVPPGVAGRENDAWSVQLSQSTSVNAMHKLQIEDDESHARSYIWSFAVQGEDLHSIVFIFAASSILTCEETLHLRLCQPVVWHGRDCWA